MANALFDAYREDCLDSSAPDLSTATIKLVFVDHADDTPAPTTDDFLDDILAGARVSTSGAFTSKTVTAGTFDAGDVTVTAVSGDQKIRIIVCA